MIRVGILGATGYTAAELIRLLLRHPHAEVTQLTTRQGERPHVREVHPRFAGQLDLHLEQFNPDDEGSIERFAGEVDTVFCCLPHTASAQVVTQLLERDKRVVDFSADYRLNDVATYEEWYRVQHPDPDSVGRVVYGLPELFRESIRDAKLVANPGCYPTAAILGLAPLIRHQLVHPEGIIVDAKTGVTGGGRNPKPNFHFPECNESITAYGVGTHRHMPEIDQILSRAFETPLNVIFTPHLVPMDRGILATIYARPLNDLTPQGLDELYREFYADESFVRVVEQPPATKQTAFTNFCDVAVRVVRGQVVVLSSIDNLVKGASGAAVQNFNLMHGFDETTALLP